jgi:hypothetical protein
MTAAFTSSFVGALFAVIDHVSRAAGREIRAAFGPPEFFAVSC